MARQGRGDTAWGSRAAPVITIAGLVIHEARSIAEAGQSLTFYGFHFEVLRRNRNRLEPLRITPVTQAQKVAAKGGTLPVRRGRDVVWRRRGWGFTMKLPLFSPGGREQGLVTA